MYWPVSSGPNVQIFGRFKKFWDPVDKTKYKSGVEDTIVTNIVMNDKKDLSTFITRYLQVLFEYNFKGRGKFLTFYE